VSSAGEENKYIHNINTPIKTKTFGIPSVINDIPIKNVPIALAINISNVVKMFIVNSYSLLSSSDL
jgi:hypothetical protein